MKIMAFIPARGGSKGIPKKNLAILNGKPLIQYTIEAARNSRYINDIFLSSDDDDIIEFCKSLGISVPYKRPAELASDASPVIDAILHALDWLKNNNREIPDSIMLLQPTSPLRRSRHIDESIELFLSARTESLISVHKMTEHPYECLSLKKDGWEFLAKPSIAIIRRQDYKDEFYFINGAIYLVKTDFLIRKRVFFIEGKTILYFMDPTYGIDIDNTFDLQKAEFYMQNMYVD